MTKTITRGIAAVALITALGASAAFASSKVPAETRTQVTEKLTAEGYDVRKVKMEDGMIEAYVVKDGQKLELYLDSNLNVVRTKTDD